MWPASTPTAASVSREQQQETASQPRAVNNKMPDDDATREPVGLATTPRATLTPNAEGMSTPTTEKPAPTATRPPPTTVPKSPTPSPDASSQDKPTWIKDGISEDESPTVRALHQLRRSAPQLADTVTKMPFLESHHHHDAAAVTSLAYLAHVDAQVAQRIVDHYTERQGINEADAPYVALAYGQRLFGQDPFSTLDAERVRIITRETTLHDGMTATVAVAHQASAGPAEAALDAVEQALLRTARYLTYLPFETRYFIVHYGGAMPGVARGAFMNSSISLPEHHLADGGGVWLRHEIAHHWFYHEEPWLNEGLAQTMAVITATETPPQQLETPALSCSTGATISKTAHSGQLQSQCVYDLSHAIMVDLYNAIGTEQFRGAVSDLYGTSLIWAGHKDDMKLLQEAFAEHETELQEALKGRY